MAFDFPSSPSEGQTYTPAGGPTYKYTSGKWTSATSGGGGSITISDTAPAGPANGAMWWESDTGRLYIYFTDADSSQWVEAAGGGRGPAAAGYRNRIINGDFAIDQRNGGALVTSSVGTAAYPVDRWFALAQAPGTITGQRIADTTNLGEYYLEIKSGTADAALLSTDFYAFGHRIEGYFSRDFGFGNAQAKSITISFWVKGNAAYTLPLSVRNAAINRAWLGSFAVTTGWTKVTLTVPGDVTGTWEYGNLVGVEIYIGLGLGSSFQGVAGWQAGNLLTLAAMSNFMAASANSLQLKDFQLEVGTQATEFERVAYDEQLARCMRYYEAYTSGVGVGFIGNVTTGVAYIAWGDFKTVKRAAPTVALTNINNTGFAATPGSATGSFNTYLESRTSNATQNGGFFYSNFTASAEL